MRVSQNLSVEPDGDGGFEITVHNAYTFISRTQADALIAALSVRDTSGRIIAPPQPTIADRPPGPHLSNSDARKPVE